MSATAEEVTIIACPGCRSSEIHSRMTLDPRYKCGNCGEEFDRPIERQPGATS